MECTHIGRVAYDFRRYYHPEQASLPIKEVSIDNARRGIISAPIENE